MGTRAALHGARATRPATRDAPLRRSARRAGAGRPPGLPLAARGHRARMRHWPITAGLDDKNLRRQKYASHSKNRPPRHWGGGAAAWDPPRRRSPDPAELLIKVTAPQVTRATPIIEKAPSSLRPAPTRRGSGGSNRVSFWHA